MTATAMQNCFVSWIAPDLLQSCCRQQDSTPKTPLRLFKIALIESHDGTCIAIKRGFQNHIVIRISQSGPPAKSQPDWFGYRGQIIQNPLNFQSVKPTGGEMFRPKEHRLVLENQRNREQQLDATIKSSQQNLTRCAAATSERSHHYVRVQHQAHFVMILQAISNVKYGVEILEIAICPSSSLRIVRGGLFF